MNAKLVADTGIMLRDVMVDYVLQQGTLQEPEGGRIIILE